MAIGLDENVISNYYGLMQFKMPKSIIFLLVATLAVMLIATLMAMSEEQRTDLAVGSAAEVLPPAGVLLANYVVTAIFAMTLIVFVLNDVSRGVAARQAASALTLLHRFIMCVTDTRLDPLRASLLRPHTGPEAALFRTTVSSHPELVPPSSPCWPMGSPKHVRYHRSPLGLRMA